MDLSILNKIRIIVLGSSGFIGRQLFQYLCKKFSEQEVIGLSTQDVDMTDPASIGQLASYFDPTTVVIMCAAIKKQKANDIESFTKNLMMVTHLAKAIRQSPIARLIYMSSAAVYGEDVAHSLINEQTCPCASSYYGASKYSSERVLSIALHEQAPVQLLILRPPSVYGWQDNNIGYDPGGFFKKAVNDQAIVLWGDGDEKREFLYIDDLVQITSELIFNSSEGVVNVVSACGYSFTQSIEYLRDLFDIPVCIERRERSKQKVDHQFDNDRLKKIVGEFKFTSLAQGLTKIHELYAAELVTN